MSDTDKMDTVEADTDEVDTDKGVGAEEMAYAEEVD